MSQEEIRQFYRDVRLGKLPPTDKAMNPSS
jgi:hypothetical protein